jgi:hypothetical protein
MGGCFREQRLRLRETIQRNRGSGQVAVRRDEFRVEPNRFAKRPDRLVVLTECARRQAQAVEGKRFARVRHRP